MTNERSLLAELDAALEAAWKAGNLPWNVVTPDLVQRVQACLAAEPKPAVWHVWTDGVTRHDGERGKCPLCALSKALEPKCEHGKCITGNADCAIGTTTTCAKCGEPICACCGRIRRREPTGDPCSCPCHQDKYRCEECCDGGPALNRGDEP